MAWQSCILWTFLSVVTSKEEVNFSQVTSPCSLEKNVSGSVNPVSKYDQWWHKLWQVTATINAGYFRSQPIHSNLVKSVCLTYSTFFLFLSTKKNNMRNQNKKKIPPADRELMKARPFPTISFGIFSHFVSFWFISFHIFVSRFFSCTVRWFMKCVECMCSLQSTPQTPHMERATLHQVHWYSSTKNSHWRERVRKYLIDNYICHI